MLISNLHNVFASSRIKMFFIYCALAIMFINEIFLIGESNANKEIYGLCIRAYGGI